MNSDSIEHFVTHFDKKYLIQGICLYRSLEIRSSSFCLWIVCLDEYSYRVLDALKLKFVKLLKIEDHLDEELRLLKTQRTTAEFCWTLTPLMPIIVVRNHPKIKRITYLDADMWFLKTFKPIFKEFEDSKCKVMITPHYFSPRYDQSLTAGFFCVQYVTFERAAIATVAEDWLDDCKNWCFNRHENGKFGDQKYLEYWDERYPNQIHVLKDRNAILAPWNAEVVPFGEAKICHFHGFKFWNNRCDPGEYNIPKPTIDFVYKKYFDEIKLVCDLLMKKEFKIEFSDHPKLIYRIKRKIRKFF